MRRQMIALLLIGGALALGLGGALLFRHFVTNRIMDRDGMVNPAASGPAADNRAVSETAQLVDFFWSQNHMNYSACFTFDLSGGPEAPVLKCRFVEVENGEYIEIGGWADMTQEEKPAVPFASERWTELEDYLRTAGLPAYRSPSPDLLDATDSTVSVCWRDGGVEFTNRYDGEHASDLLALVQSIALEVCEAMPKEETLGKLPAETEQGGT